MKFKKIRLFLSILLCLHIPLCIFSQIEGHIIEKYYFSDSYDETNDIGGVLPAGSYTYRVYLDLKTGSKLKRIFGEVNHPLIIKSDSIFWNNSADGETFAFNISKTRYYENTVALDSWLTLGQTSRSSTSTIFGILKSDDTDGSFIGGINNDGGSAALSGGLLRNESQEVNIPLTKSDGMTTMLVIPNLWAYYGFIDPITGEDTTIFGSGTSKNILYSDNISLQNSGVTGVNPELNQILVGQFTVLSEQLELELNVELIEPDGIGSKVVKYLARDVNLTKDEIHSPFLKYPYECGCQDPNYLEARKKYACENKDSCKTLIVFGCTDTIACNYNANANYHLQSLCCYIGLCNDLDLNVVCPNLSIRDRKALLKVNLYPSIVFDQINVEAYSPFNEELSFQIIDIKGKLMRSGLFGNEKEKQILLNDLPSGMYLLRMFTNDFSLNRKFIKL